eukprot:7850203-Lingulodinium_polyedra.AAC.1
MERGPPKVFHDKLKALDRLPPGSKVTVDLGCRKGPADDEARIYHGRAWSRFPRILRDGFRAVPGA